MAQADPVQTTDDMTQEQFDKLKTDRQESLVQSKNKLAGWINQHKQYSSPKFLKALILDKTGCFYENRPLTDSYSFVFRNQPFLRDIKSELLKHKPQIVVFNLEQIAQEELEANADIAYIYNNGATLQRLIRVVKEFKGEYKPVLLIFNTIDKDTETLQKTFNYESIIAVKEQMDIDLTMKMCAMLQQKIMPTIPEIGPLDMYLDKNSDVSYCEIEDEIVLRGCSETDLYFDCEHDLAENSVIRVSLPVPMYVTIKPAPDHTKVDSQFYGIIHGIGETERQELRKFINTIFFRDKQREKEAEADENEQRKKDFVEKQMKDEEGERLRVEQEKTEKEAKEKALQDKANELINSGQDS